MSRSWWLCALLMAAGCAKDEPRAAPPAPAPATTTAPPPPPPDAAAPIDAAPVPTVTTPSAATRCTLGGDPLTVPCNGGATVAATTRGDIYLTDSRGVHRYRRDAGEGCALTLDTGFGKDGTLTPPDKQPKPQVVGKGPVYMRSGGPEWRLTAGGDAVYLHDFLLGLYRIDRGTLAPVCPDLQGVKHLAIHGPTAFDGNQRLALNQRCKATPHPLEPRARFGVFGAGTDVWGKIASGKLVRYDAAGAQAAALGGEDSFAPGGLCSTVALAPCGDGVCVLDTNCHKLARFATDGSFVLERKADDLIGHQPYAMADLAAASDGALWLLTIEKDGDTCEAALHTMPAAAIAP